MSKTTNIDDKVLSLFNKVKDKKRKIKRTERVNWETSCSFSYDPETGIHDRINLHVCSSLAVLTDIYAFLLSKQEKYTTAASELGVKTPTQWLGYSIEKWKTDLKARVSQLQLAQERQELTVLENRLDSLITVDQRRAMELDAIEEELGE